MGEATQRVMTSRTLWMVAVMLLCVTGEVSPVDLKTCRLQYCKQGRTVNQTINPALMNLAELSKMPCQCDEDCHVYADCCHDLATGTTPDNINGVHTSLWDCIPMMPRKIRVVWQYMYGVGGCPSGDDLSELCDKTPGADVGMEYHYTLDVPVYSLATRTHYANVFCATCHGQLKHLRPARFKFYCTSNLTYQQALSVGQYQKGKLKWKMGERDTCYLFQASREEPEGRPCVPSVGSCPQQTPSTPCLTYNFLVRRNNIVYKNPDCAECNAAYATDLHCHSSMVMALLPSLSVVMDFDWDFSSCPPGALWYGLERRCKGEREAPRETEDVGPVLEGYLTLACLGASSVCLCLHLLLYHCREKARTVPSGMLARLASAMLASHVLFLVGVRPLVPLPALLCTAVAAAIHYAFLASVFWMNAMSADLWRTFSRLVPRGDRRLVSAWYSAWAWGGAGAVAGAALLAEAVPAAPDFLRPRYGGGYCWFGNRAALGVFLFLPVSALVLVNTALFVATVWGLRRHEASPELARHATGRKDVARLWLCAKLSTMMGLSWAFAVAASFSPLDFLWYVFIVLNGLQGLFLFVMFGLKGALRRAPDLPSAERSKSTELVSFGMTSTSKVS